MSERNLKLIVEYDGTAYHGWQRQQDLETIQCELEKTLESILHHQVTVIGASRTDAGVHALGQTCNFHTDCSIPAEKIPYALNALLPDDIVVISASEVPDEFHSRFSTKGKKYRYLINNSRIPSALNKNREYFCPYKLNLDLMKEMAGIISGTHDFKGFMAAGSAVEDTVRTIYSFDVIKENSRVIVEISGNGFLYNMVRILVGTLIDVGRGKIPLQEVNKLLIEGDRKNAGRTVPPQGLYLMEVYY